MVYVNASSDESCDLPMVEANAVGIPAVVFFCGLMEETRDVNIKI